MSDEAEASPKDRLSAGLREAFGADPPVGKSSVLARLAARGTPPVRVLLREESGADPLLRVAPGSLRAADLHGARYQLLGEIARGGIGVILKAHDADLGRDVAMKVLHDEHRDDPSLLARFIEEAQVESQLQHPGIVPVYDFGLQADERPFFTMKLIRGRTLAALLAERRGREDRRRFLGIFEQVCQTIAYAHARGVVHRDLKPSNMMVGDFGEVQVVDWGLSKVLRQGGTADEATARQVQRSLVETVRSRESTARSDSLAGSVMGTPAYMPPEQAHGDVEKLDERADVFALGAILCEILTGLPPYAGGREEALRQASSAQLGRARELLRACDADRELVEICECCLRPERTERPRNAEALAERLARYRAAVEERAEGARITAALASEKAAGARRAQRLTIAIAASLLLALGLGTGLLWIRSTHERGRSLFTAQVRARLADIRQVLGRAQAAAVGDLAAWNEAGPLLAQVASLVASGDAEGGLRAEVADLGLAVDAGRGEAVARADGERRDQAMLGALEEVVTHVEAAAPETVAAQRESVHNDPANHARRRRDLYRQAFDAYGIDVLEAPVEVVIAQVARSRIADRLATALDDWGSALHRLEDADGPRLRRIAFEADRDPWRRKLRELLSVEEPSVAALVAHAAEMDPASMPVVSVVFLARELRDRGAHAEAIRILDSALLVNPQSFLLAMEIGKVRLNPPDRDARAAQLAFCAAAHLNPRSSGAWTSYGGSSFLVREWQRGISATRKAIEVNPENWTSHVLLSRALLDRSRGAISRQDEEEAVEAARRAVTLKPSVHNYRNLGRVRRVAGDPDGAIEAFREATRRDPDEAEAHYELGAVLRGEGDLRGSIDSYGEAIRCNPEHVDARYERGLAFAVLGEPGRADEEWRRLIGLCVEHFPRHPRLPDFYVAMGQILHARSRSEESIEWQGKALALAPRHPTALFELGHAYRLARRLDEAVGTLRRAVEVDGSNVAFRYQLATALLESRLFEAAIEECLRLLELDPDHATARLILCSAQLNLGRPDEAVEIGQKGWELGSRHPDWPDAAQARKVLAAAWYALGRAFQFGIDREPDPDRAIAAYERAIELHATGEEYRNLAWIHARRGDYSRVVACLEKSHEIGSSWWPFPSAGWLEDWRSIVERQERHLDLLDGRVISEDATELRRAATLGYYVDRHVASERLWREAFALRPELADDLPWMNRFQAARAAALAGCGQGEGAGELDDETREALRLAAAEWLREELRLISSRLGEDGEIARRLLAAALIEWRDCPELAAVREARELERWSPLERDDWRELWAEAAELLRKAGEPAEAKAR